ncbi:hypothetical protein [Streptomyces albus]|uniref:hypothetical protein n=1 Tax=Streptomyces albus TaxID=1888 RepID=UPI0033F453E8
MSRALRAARRLAAHEARSLSSIPLWLARRRTGVGPCDLAAPYSAAQAATLLGLGFVCVVETVVLALLVTSPPVHAVLLVVDGYGLLTVTGLHAACVVRPHVVHPDGSLRLRYGALLDVAIPAGLIASASVDRRFDGGQPAVSEETLTVPVGGQTSVTVQLTGPVTFRRPLGAVGTARTLRLHTEEPDAMVRALLRGRARESRPVPPGER